MRHSAHTAPPYDPLGDFTRYGFRVPPVVISPFTKSGYLLRYCGYVLTGYTREHCLPFWYGHGANGKGTLLNVLQNIMGFEYATALRMSNLAAKKNEDDSQRRIIAKLCGARLATANEGNANVKLDMAPSEELG